MNIREGITIPRKLDTVKPADLTTELLTPDSDEEHMNVSNEFVLDIDKYGGLFYHHPTVDEVRSKFKSPTNKTLKDLFIEQNLIDSNYDTIPKYTIIRTANADDTVVPTNSIGNRD